MAVKKRKSKGKSKAQRPELSDIWPQERDFMARPERFRYVRKLIKTEGCVFCNAIEMGVNDESLILWKNQYAMIMMNKYPYNSGHLLVLPTRHCGNLLDLKENEYLEIQKQIRRALKAVNECFECTGSNIGLNHGKVAGAGIPDHLHWHIVPRWNGDTNFFPLIAETKVLIETLEQTYARLSPYLKEPK